MREALVLFVVLVGCGSDGDGDAPARSAIHGHVDVPTAGVCSMAGADLTFGLFRPTDQVPIKNNSNGERGKNYITCRVADAGGDKFTVDASMKNDNRVIFAIKGTFPKTTDAKGFQVDSSTLGNGLVGTEYGAITQSDGKCTVVYATAQQGASAGRVWGQVTCPNATNDANEGGHVTGSCTATTQFLFEDCDN